MGRVHAIDEATGRSRIGRAVLVAAGVGTVMAAGAGLASAAEAPSLAMAPTGPSTALDQSALPDASAVPAAPDAGSLPSAPDASALPSAPNLSLSDGSTDAKGSNPADLGNVDGADLAALGFTNGGLSGLGSGAAADDAGN